MTINAQEYNNKNLTDKTIKKIILDSYYSDTKGLAGDLTIQDYPQLEEINLSNQELTSLTILNCPNLKQINVRQNQLTKLELESPELTELIAGKNELTVLNLANC